MYYPLGLWKGRQFLSAGWGPELERHLLYIAAYGYHIVEKTTPGGKYQVILDLADLSYWQTTYYDGMKYKSL